MVARMSNRMFEAVAEAAGDKSPYRALLPGAPTLRGRAQRLVDTLRVAFRKWGQGLHFAEAGQAAEDLAQLYRLRAGIERLDAQGVRALVTAQERLRRTEVPGSYAELFSGEPLRDPRLFVANREVLATLVRAERAWQSQPDAGNAVLVLGTSGTGKSSTLGVARLKVGSRRVVIVRPAAEGEPSLVAALAHAIGTETSVEGLIQTLRGQRSAIVVDDLHHWFEPTTEGVVAFEEFLALVAATGSSTFWIAAMASEAFEVWNETVPLSQAFASIPHLRPVGARELEAVVTSRHDLSGLELEFPRTLGSRLAKRILSRSARASFVRHLAADANGNLRRSMALWLAHARPSGDRIVLVPVHAFGWELPFIRPMKPAVKATLAMLVRHGALREATLARCMGASEDEARQTVRFLVAAGLVERGAVAGQYAIRMSLRDDLVFALIDEGLLGGGD
jgi:hypothetical protein